MTIAKAWPFQEAVFAAIEAALPGVPGYAYIPERPDLRHWRIDGWTIDPTEVFKNKDRAEHGVTVHVMDAPENGTRDLQWVKETIATIHTALQDFRLDADAGKLVAQSADARLEPRDDKRHDAHAFIRYNAALE